MLHNLAKWADFVITHVQYNSDNSRIVQVKRRTDNGEKLIKPEIKNRSVIVDSIHKGYSYVTGRYVNDEWNKGDRVIAYLLDGEHFIRTDGNKTKSDNLGELPEF